MRKAIMAGLAVVALLSTGCANTADNSNTMKNSNLTHGNVQMTLKKGVTTKAQVIESFGSPNITTIDASGKEVWTYQRHATVANSSSSSSGWTVILAGGSNKAAGFEQSSRTITLIIKFDDNDTVYDFKSRSTSF
ncbi:MAG: hypothetical protein ACPF9E_18845 [Alteromonas oceani]